MRERYVEGACSVCGETLYEAAEYDEDGYEDGCTPSRCEDHMGWSWDDETKRWTDDDGVEYDEDLRKIEEEEDKE